MKTVFVSFVIFTAIVMSSCSESKMPSESHPLLRSTSENSTVQTNDLKGTTYSADLTGNSTAVGRAVFKFLDGNTKLHYRLHVFNINNVTASHVHHAHDGASTGHAILTLFEGQTDEFSGKLAEGILTADDITCTCPHQDHHTLSHVKQHFDDGETYVNVHTTQNPTSEIRGWIFLR